MPVNNAINRVVTATPTANAVSLWDTNLNMSANNLLGGFTTTARVNSTTYPLTVASATTQEWTGTSNFGDAVLMPVTTTLVTGTTYQLYNNSDQPLNVQTSAGTAILTLAAGTNVVIVCRLASGTTAASWFWNANTIATLPGVLNGGWTPTLTAQTPGTISVSYATQAGSYLRINTSPAGGSYVYLQCRLTCTPTWGTASGDIRITGLPFTANGGGSGAPLSQSGSNMTWSTSRTMLTLAMFQSPIAITINKQISAQNSANMQVGDITTATSVQLNFCMWYQI